MNQKLYSLFWLSAVPITSVLISQEHLKICLEESLLRSQLKSTLDLALFADIASLFWPNSRDA